MPLSSVALRRELSQRLRWWIVRLSAQAVCAVISSQYMSKHASNQIVQTHAEMAYQDVFKQGRDDCMKSKLNI